jgi:hypothetical protein
LPSDDDLKEDPDDHEEGKTSKGEVDIANSEANTRQRKVESEG